MGINTSLGTDFYDPTKSATDAVVSPKAGQSDKLEQNMLQAAEAKGGLAKQQDVIKSTLGAKKAAAESEGAETYAQAVKQPELRSEISEKIEQQSKPFIPTQETAGDLANVFMLTNILGFMIGKGAKGSAQAALSAQNGMLEGHQKGREDLYKKEKDVFEENQKVLTKSIQNLKDKLKEAMDMAAVDHNAGMQKAYSAIASEGASMMNDALNKYGLAYTYDLAKDAYNINVKKEETLARLKHDTEQRAYQERQLALREREAAEAARHHSALESQGAGRMEASKEKQLTKEVLPIIQGIRSVEHLQDQLRDPEVQKGLLSRAAPFFEKLNSLGNDKEFESAVNNAVELTGVDKTTLFLKDALLEQYAIDRAAKNGQRLTVQDIKMTGPVLDPTNYSPQTYNALLDNRRKVLYNNAQDYGLSPQDIAEKTRQRPYTPYGGQAPTAAPAPAAPAKTSGGVTVSNW